MKYLKYLEYLLKHKWYVMIECFKEGLVWRGLVHDLSKFLPDEFFPYANYFYGNYKSYKEASMFEKTYFNFDYKEDVARKFDFAWLLHQKRNPHHWQWWILREDDGGIKTLNMKQPYLIEMICDWVGAGKAQGHLSPKNDRYYETRKWYRKNSKKMRLNQRTRNQLDTMINL